MSRKPWPWVTTSIGNSIAESLVYWSQHASSFEEGSGEKTSKMTECLYRCPWINRRLKQTTGQPGVGQSGKETRKREKISSEHRGVHLINQLFCDTRGGYATPKA